MNIGKIVEFLMGILALIILIWIAFYAVNEFGLVWNTADHTSICKP